MKVSEQWLREWVNPKQKVGEIAQTLTMSGLEVDSIELAAPAFSNIVVGEVKTCVPHPNADKLRCCEVDVGEAALANIVCGAPNVRSGLKVAVAKVGALLPGDFKIKKAKLRGEPSHGMICSARELGLSDEHAGIMELAADATVGMCIRDYFALDDAILDIELTANRGDCLSILGVAREVGVNTSTDLNTEAIAKLDTTVAASIDDQFAIEVTESKVCPRYLGRVICDIKSDVETPLWMQERLRRCGVRCIHPVVDVLNYVMLELGTPMHAFDLATLHENVNVRFAHANEKLTLLDGQDVVLDADQLVIADSKQAQAIAGIMGGEASSVTEKTQTVFLEAAYFDPIYIRRTAKAHGLQTDASYRFERGVDFNALTRAMEKATQLILDIAGGQAGPINEVVNEAVLPKPHRILLRREQMTRLLGITIDDKDVVTILTRLDMQVQPNEQGWDVIAPSFRFDIFREVDLIEECARIYGYEQVPMQRMKFSEKPRAVSGCEVTRDRIANALVDRGYCEAVTYSFIHPKVQALLQPEQKALALTNPISSELSVMRSSIWPGLVMAYQHNQAHQCQRVRLFEMGRCFLDPNHEVGQPMKLALLAAGPVVQEQWGDNEKRVDFFDVKADVESIMALSGQQQLSWQAASHPALHPGQSAQCWLNGEPVGWIGALHPSHAKALDLPFSPILVELDYDLIKVGQRIDFKHISKFPSVRRDLALVVDEAITAATLIEASQAAAGALCHQVDLFDIYQGDGIEAGKKSVALALHFQDFERTLTDSEISAIIQNVVTQLGAQFGANLRA